MFCRRPITHVTKSKWLRGQVVCLARWLSVLLPSSIAAVTAAVVNDASASQIYSVYCVCPCVYGQLFEFQVLMEWLTTLGTQKNIYIAKSRWISFFFVQNQKKKSHIHTHRAVSDFTVVINLIIIKVEFDHESVSRCVWTRYSMHFTLKQSEMYTSCTRTHAFFILIHQHSDQSSETCLMRSRWFLLRPDINIGRRLSICVHIKSKRMNFT